MDIKAYLPKTEFSLTTAKLTELHKYADTKTSTIGDALVARVNAATLIVFALGDVVVHAAVAVAKTAIAAVELPLYVVGSGEFTGTAAEVWCHTTHSIRSAITIFGSLAGIAKPEWTLDVYDWVALDVTAPKGLLAETARQVREAARNAWNSPRRNLVTGCAVVVAFVALGYVYLAPPTVPTVPTGDNVGGSTPPNQNAGGLKTEGNKLTPAVATDGFSSSSLARPFLAFGGLGAIGAAMWWATRSSQKGSNNSKMDLIPADINGVVPLKYEDEGDGRANAPPIPPLKNRFDDSDPIAFSTRISFGLGSDSDSEGEGQDTRNSNAGTPLQRIAKSKAVMNRLRRRGSALTTMSASSTLYHNEEDSCLPTETTGDAEQDVSYLSEEDTSSVFYIPPLSSSSSSSSSSRPSSSSSTSSNSSFKYVGSADSLPAFTVASQVGTRSTSSSSLPSDYQDESSVAENPAPTSELQPGKKTTTKTKKQKKRNNATNKNSPAKRASLSGRTPKTRRQQTESTAAGGDRAATPDSGSPAVIGDAEAETEKGD